MISLAYDLVSDHQSELLGFGQVFLASGILVAFGYWMKARLLRRWGISPSRRSRPTRPVRQKQKSTAKRSAYFELARVAEPPADAVAVEPESPQSHSERIAALVRMTIARGERAAELHERALTRLESADYALQRLVMELAHLISVPQKPVPADPVSMISAPGHMTRLAA